MLIASYAKLTNEQDIDMAITKLDRFGNVDSSFGSSGQVVVAFDNGGDNQDILNDIVVYPDGRILLIGAAQSVRGDFDFAVVRLNPNGSYDTTFAGDGKRTFFIEEGGNNNDYAISAILVTSGTENQPDIIIGNVEQVVGVHIGAFRISKYGAELFFANTRFNLNISSNRITGALAIVKGYDPTNVYWILGYADEGFNKGTSPYLIRVNDIGELLLLPNSSSNHFVATDNRDSTWISGVAQVPNSDKFVFVGGDSHGGIGFEDCAVTFVNTGSLEANNVPFSAEFNFELDPLNNHTPCTDAVFTSNSALILSGDLYPDDLSDIDMVLFKLSSIDVVNNDSGTNASSAIDTSFGSQGAARIFFDTGGINTTNQDTSKTVKIGADGNIILVGSAMFDGFKTRTAVTKVINNDVIFKNDFE